MSCRLTTISSNVSEWLCNELQKEGSSIGEEIGSGVDGCVHKLKTQNGVSQVIKCGGTSAIDFYNIQSIKHPAIVGPIRSYYWDGKVVARIYPYVSGEPFSSQKMKFMELSSEKQFRFLLLLAEGCKALHDWGVQHGDLNRSNVMCDGNFSQPHIIDFDSVRSIDSLPPDKPKFLDEWKLIQNWLNPTIVSSITIPEKEFLESCVDRLNQKLLHGGREGIMDLYISFMKNCIDHVSVLENIPSKL